MLPDRPAEPWLSFFTDLDAALTVLPSAARVIELAGKSSALHKHHKIYIDHVRVANYPASYEEHL